MDKKFQVFISSTYLDLKDERQAAVEAVLEAGHIPAGMELFAAGDETQMKVIKDWIESSDIYLLILGGRYGSIEPRSGKSYIHKEYEYAISIKKPFFALVVDDGEIKARIASDPSLGEKDNPNALGDFRKIVLRRMSATWKDTTDIKLQVQRSLTYFSQHRDIKGGWIRSEEKDAASDKEKEYQQLINQLDQKVKKLIEDKEKLKSDHEFILRQLSKERETIRKVIGEYEIRIGTLNAEKEDFQSKSTQLAIKSEAFQNELKQSALQIKQLATERDAIKKAILDYELRIKQLVGTVETLENKIKQLGQSNKTLQDEKVQLGHFLANLQNEKKQLFEDNETLQEEKKRLVKSTENLQNEIRQLAIEKDSLQNQLLNSKNAIQDLNKKIVNLEEKIDTLEKGTPTYHGLSFAAIKRELLNAQAKILTRGQIEKIKKNREYKKIAGNVEDAIQYFLSHHTLLNFYWIFSRLLDYGISKDEADAIPEIHSNLKRLVDFGLVKREKGEHQTFFVNTESGKNFLLELIITRDPVARETLILG